MTERVRVFLEIDAPPARVWEVVANPRNLPLWDRHIVAVEGVPEEGLSVGDRYHTVVRFMLVRASIDAEVLDRREPYLSCIRLRGLLEAEVTTKIEELPGDASLLEHEVEYHFRGGPIGELAEHSLRLLGGDAYVLRHGTLAQKMQVEAG